MNAPTATAPTVPFTLSQRQLRFIVSALILGLFLSALDSNIVGTAMPTIVGQLGGFAKIAWVSTAYSITSTISTLVLGKLSDIYGRRKIYLLSTAGFLVGSVLCALAGTMNQLIAFRAIQGIGGGGLYALTFAIIGEIVSPRERGKYFGLFTGTFAVAGVAGPLIGGFLVDQVGWQWIFLVNAPLGLISLAITARFLRGIPFRTRKAAFDYAGAAAMAVSIGALMIALERGSNDGWLSGGVLALAAIAVAALIAFLAIEGKAAEPLLPLRLFSIPTMRWYSFMGFMIGFGVLGGMFLFPLYFQDVRFISPTRSGLAMIPQMIGITGSSIIVGQIIARTGRYKPMPLIGIPAGALGFLLWSRVSVHSPYAGLAVMMFLIGLGFGMSMPSVSIATQNSVPLSDLGIATSVVTFLRTLGASIGLAVFGSIFNSRLQESLAGRLPGQSPKQFARLLRAPGKIKVLPPKVRDAVTGAITDGLSRAWSVAAVVVLVGVVFAALAKEIPLRTQTGFNAPVE